MTTIRLELPPTTNASFKVGKGRFYETSEYQNWKMVAQLQARTECKHDPTDQDIELEVEFHQKFGGDIDGRLKPLLDALQGVIYINDRQIIKLTVTKHKAAAPHCLIHYRLNQATLFA